MNVFSSACFAGCAAAFFIAAYGSARSLLRRATDGSAIFLRSLRELRCRIFSLRLKLRKMRRTYTGISIGFTALKFFS